MFNKAQLIERGRHYFDDSKIDKMYATPDGNFFYESNKSFADSHAKTKKIEVITITRSDLIEEKPKSKREAPKDNDAKKNDLKDSPSPESPKSTDNSLDLDALKAEGKKLKIKGFAIMKAETLKKKIEDATS